MKVDIRYILPAALAADLMIPFLMAPFYKGYSHTAQVMSVLGNHRAPLHSLYNGWLILLGGIILCSSFSLRCYLCDCFGMAVAETDAFVYVFASQCCLYGAFMS